MRTRETRSKIIATITAVIMIAALFAGCGVEEKSISVKASNVKKTTAKLNVKLKTDDYHERIVVKEVGVVYSTDKSDLVHLDYVGDDTTTKKKRYNDTFTSLKSTPPAKQFPDAKIQKRKVNKTYKPKQTVAKTIKAKKLIPGMNYYYRVYVKSKAYLHLVDDPKGEAGPTVYVYYKVKSFKTEGKSPVVPAVKSFTVTPHYDLKWSKVKNAVYYEISRSTDGNNYKTIYPDPAFIKKNPGKYDDPPITEYTDILRYVERQTIYYRIRAALNYDGLNRLSKYTTLKIDDEKGSPSQLVLFMDTVKTSYYSGDELDLTGGKAELWYTSNAVDVMELTSPELYVSGYDKTKLGHQTVAVTHTSSGVSSDFDVNVHSRPYD